MRYLVSLAIIIIAQAGAAWATGDLNTARPGAAFATIEAESAAACERLCADDTLCMAWNFHANSCELKAVVPPAVAQEGVISGLSTRAPASLRTRLAPTPAPQPEQASAAEEQATEPPPEDEVSLALLGGPDPSEGLRLGN
jgi:hypothetical protein